MLVHVLFAIFYLFQFSHNISWNPCPALRSTFQGIYVDNEGRKRPNCVCKHDLFGDHCQFKAYVSSYEGGNSHEQEIYPLEYFHLKHGEGRVVLSWRHENIKNIEHYVIQFRELLMEDLTSLWRALAYMKASHNQSLMLFQCDDLYNFTTYEVNLGIVSNNQVIYSVSVLHDPWCEDHDQDVLLHDVMFSASTTWSSWSTWGTCETLHGCGKGKQRRKRVLETNDCVRNKSEETRPCKLRRCPVNGGWSQWSGWSTCSVTCKNGTRSRLRTCSSPFPSYGGDSCFGVRRISEACGENCNEVSTKATWKPLQKFKSLEFTSIIVGFAAGFTMCLFIALSPYLLKRCKRSLTGKYIFPYKLNKVKVTPAPIPPPPPPPPPPPGMNWRQATLPSSLQQTQSKNDAWKYVQPKNIMQAANNLFMAELLKAFKTFNVDANKTFGSSTSDKESQPVMLVPK